MVRQIVTAVVVSALALVGCVTPDWGSTLGLDAGDSGADADAQQSGTPDGGGGHAGVSGSHAGDGAGGASESDGGTDPACETAPTTTLSETERYCDDCASRRGDSCCIARGLCCAQNVIPLLPLDFANCKDGASLCESPAEPFGPSDVAYRGGAFIPAPSASERSGLIMQGMLDPRQRIRFGASLQLANSTECFDCTEIIGIALTPRSELTPVLSIVVSSELSQVIVASGSKTVWSAAVDRLQHDFELEHDPDGTTRLLIGGRLSATLRIPLPSAELRALIFGRTEASSKPATPARIFRAWAGMARCEQTAAWESRTGLTLDGAPAQPRSPSVIELPSERWLAFEAAGTIHFARAAVGGTGFELIDFTLGAGESAFESRSVGDPEWVVELDGGLALYYTAVGQDGLRSMGRARFVGQLPGEVSERGQLAQPGKLGQRELFGPSVLRDPQRTTLLAATALDAKGGSSIRLYQLSEGSTGVTLVETATVVTASKGVSDAEFTALGTSDLILRRGHYQLYFAAVSGGRWSTALTISTDRRLWLAAGIVLPTGASTEFDGSGVLDPDAVVEGEGLSLYYSGYSAATKDSWQIGRATRGGSAVCGGRDCGPHSECAGTGGSCGCVRGYVNVDGKCVQQQL